MDAVWSFWSPPYRAHRRSTWTSDRHHLLAWILSLEAARPHFAHTCLYTDDWGYRLLVDRLGLQFDLVSTALNACASYEPGWWAAGKLYCYSIQNGPFVHIDTDVFLWKGLPQRLEDAPVLSQSPEYFTPGASFYQPESFERTLRSTRQGWLPDEWKWYRRSGGSQRGDCCGIFGGSDLGFIRHYATRALRILTHPLNQPGWTRFGEKIGQMVTVEQYFLSACVEYHGAHGQSRFNPVRMEYLFDTEQQLRDPRRVREMGYTHLVAGAKRNHRAAQKIEDLVRRDYPAQYQKVLALSSRSR